MIHRLVYTGRLPRPQKGGEHWVYRYRLKRAALKTFGVLPVPATQKALITLTRVLGPKQRPYDVENFAYQQKGLVDALKAGRYLVDDSPKWVTISYIQDERNRAQGPCILIDIRYTEE